MYSIDKVKLYLYGIKLPLIKVIMKNLELDNLVTAYESYKITSCRYNYKVKKFLNGKESIYLGIEPNWTKSSDRNRSFRDLIIEYNPNKINIRELYQFYFLSNINQDRIEIKSLDVAFDIYTHDINELVVYKRHGSEYKAIIEHNKLETIYLGAFGTNGHIKIYNKAKEQNISDDMKWTRFEITYKNLGFMDIRDTEIILKTKLPNIFIINKGLELEDLKGNDKFLVLASMENYDLLHLLDKRKSRKIKEYHARYLESLNIDINKIIEVYKNFEIK